MSSVDSTSPLRVVFLCTHNSARSQMAEGLARQDFGQTGAAGELPVEAYSAGVVKRGVHPLAVQALQQVGIDASQHVSKTLTDLQESVGTADGGTADGGQQFDVVVTVCDNAREACPYLPARVLNVHRRFTDPSALEDPDQQPEAFARVRDEIRAWLRQSVPEWIELARAQRQAGQVGSAAG